jgi:hypothetical protein
VSDRQFQTLNVNDIACAVLHLATL